MKKSILFLILIFPGIIFAQIQENQIKSSITFSGFVKNDFFLDTRQNVSIREGHFLLYPKSILLDSVGEDINAGANFNFVSIQSRLSGKITGPDAFGAKTSGVLEADFFGNENASFVDANGFRLRHAFAKLNWAKTELLFGQYWHPLFIPSNFPGVISFNTGVPFQPFSRNPQIRLTHKINKISIIGVVNSQRDFVSSGGSDLIRNSAVPEVNLQLQFATKNDSAKTEFIAGIGAGYKTLRPRLSSTAGGKVYKVDETVGSYVATAFMKIVVPAVTVKFQGVYGQNLTDLVMLGGFAVDTIADPVTGKVNYSPYNTLSLWFDANTNGKKIQVGIFAGYTQNLGLDKELAFTNATNIINGLKSTSRGYDIKSVSRISPRIVFISGKFNLAVECEYTNVAYAAKTNNILDIDNKGIVQKTENVANVRTLFSVIYNF